MEEAIKHTITQTVYFEGGRQEITLTLSFKNCKKNDYRNLTSVINTILKDIKTELEISHQGSSS